MVHISIHQTEHDCDVVIQGHAGYADPGEDIVCSAVSSLWQTLISSLQLTDSSYQVSNDLKELHIQNVDKYAGLLLDSFRIGAYSIAESYPDNVKVSDW